MGRNVVLEVLKAHAPELRKLGVLTVSLFGSMARDDAEIESDVDLAVTLSEGPDSGLACLARIDDLKVRLAAIIGRPASYDHLARGGDQTADRQSRRIAIAQPPRDPEFQRHGAHLG